MENNPIIENHAVAAEEKEMKLTADDKRYLLSTAKWTEFLCITMFVCIGLVLLSCLMLLVGMCFVNGADVYGSGLSAAAMLPLIIAYSGLFLIYLIPTLYMWRFARKARSAIASGDGSEMTLSLMNLRAGTKFYGIMTIVSFALMFVMVIVIAIMSIAGLL